MARPKAKELTERELEVMQVFWGKEPAAELTAPEVRDLLAKDSRDLAYTTVATLIRILLEKGFLKQTSDTRPFRYRAQRTFDDVSGSMLSDLVERVFHGSREVLLMHLIGQKKLSKKERALLESILDQEGKK